MDDLGGVILDVGGPDSDSQLAVTLTRLNTQRRSRKGEPRRRLTH